MTQLLEALSRIRALDGFNPFPLNQSKEFGYNIGIETATRIIEEILGDNFNPDEVRELCSNTDQYERGE